MQTQESCEICLNLEFPSAEFANKAMASVFVKRNEKKSHEHRSSTEARVKNNSLIVCIKAQDRIALRASLNSRLKLTALAIEILEA